MKPEVRIRIYPSPVPEYAFIIRASIREEKPCNRCCYKWMSCAGSTLTDRELRENGVKYEDVQKRGHPLVRLKIQEAVTKVEEYHAKPMDGCKRCQHE